MKFAQLPNQVPDEHHGIERSEEAAIEGEIARPLLDLAEVSSHSRAAEFVGKLHAIHLCEPAALWAVLRILSGNLDELTRSYEDIGHEQHRSKQAVQQEWERVLRALHAHFPRVEKVLVELRSIKASYNR